MLYANEKLITHFNLHKETNFPLKLESFLGHNNLEQFHHFVDNNDLKEQKSDLAELRVFDTIYKANYSIIPTKNERLFLFTISEKDEEQPTKELSTEIFPFIFFEINLEGQIKSYNHHLINQLLYSDKDISSGLYLKKILSSGSKPIAESLLENFDEFKDHEYIELKL
ncbi:MAG: hypothetical protein HC831_00400 [Chloroflexia bacterium]|nr:hypothetical protein [Chloroflexia bacterium]